VALYDVRNRRGVEHVGGDVSANHMDAELVLAMSKWIVAELVRLFHNIHVKTASGVVDALMDRTLPVIWEVEGVKRILDTSLPLADQTLVLLYAEPGAVSEKDLARYLEQDRLANYRRILDRLHKTRVVEWNKTTGLVTLSPLGRVELPDPMSPRPRVGTRLGDGRLATVRVPRSASGEHGAPISALPRRTGMLVDLVSAGSPSFE
jgi:hypothetical protein